MRLSQCHLRAVLVLAVSWIACGEATAQPPAPAHVTLTASDGAKLKATYPNSANTYDSLSDALLAAGNRKEALHNAEKALEVLDRDKSAPDEFRAAIKESAEKKISELKKGT